MRAATYVCVRMPLLYSYGFEEFRSVRDGQTETEAVATYRKRRRMFVSVRL